MHIVALLSRMLSAVLRAIVVLVSGKTQTESPSIYLLVQCVTSLGGGVGTPIWNRRGCSSEILNSTLKETIWAWLKLFVTSKGDRSGRGSSFL